MSGAVAGVNSRLASCLLFIGVGIAARALKLLTAKDGATLLKFLFTLCLPAVFLTTFTRLQFDAAAGAIMTVGAAHGLISTVLGFAAYRGRGTEQAAVMSGSAIGLNLGLFAYPFCDAMWGLPGLMAVIAFDLVNQTTLLLAQYGVFYHYVGSGDFWRAIRTRLTTSPLFLSLYAALAMQAFQWQLPELAASVVGPIASCSKPLALVTLGILLDPRIERRQATEVTAVLGLRYGLGLAVAAAAAALAAAPPALLAAQRGALLVGLVSPVPMLAIQYSLDFGLDASLAAATVNVSVLISILLIVLFANVSATPAGLAAPAALCLALSEAARRALGPPGDALSGGAPPPPAKAGAAPAAVVGEGAGGGGSGARLRARSGGAAARPWEGAGGWGGGWGRGAARGSAPAGAPLSLFLPPTAAVLRRAAPAAAAPRARVARPLSRAAPRQGGALQFAW